MTTYSQDEAQARNVAAIAIQAAQDFLSAVRSNGAAGALMLNIKIDTRVLL